MMRYFFDIVKDGHLDCDQEGTDLPSLDVARVEAGRCAGEIIRCAASTALPKRWTMSIRDHHGHVMTTLSFRVSDHRPA